MVFTHLKIFLCIDHKFQNYFYSCLCFLLIMSPIKRSKKTTLHQFQIMLDFFENHPEMINGKISDRFNGRRREKLWVELSTLLNSDNYGPQKTPMKWRKTWTDIKSETKQKVKEEQSHFGNLNLRHLPVHSARIRSLLGFSNGDYCKNVEGNNSADQSHIKIKECFTEERTSNTDMINDEFELDNKTKPVIKIENVSDILSSSENISFENGCDTPSTSAEGSCEKVTEIFTSDEIPCEKVTKIFTTSDEIPCEKLREILTRSDEIPCEKGTEILTTSDEIPCKKLREILTRSNEIPCEKVTEILTTSDEIPCKKLREILTRSDEIPCEKVTEILTTSDEILCENAPNISTSTESTCGQISDNLATVTIIPCEKVSYVPSLNEKSKSQNALYNFSIPSDTSSSKYSVNLSNSKKSSCDSRPKKTTSAKLCDILTTSVNKLNDVVKNSENRTLTALNALTEATVRSNELHEKQLEIEKERNRLYQERTEILSTLISAFVEKKVNHQC